MWGSITAPERVDLLSVMGILARDFMRIDFTILASFFPSSSALAQRSDSSSAAAVFPLRRRTDVRVVDLLS
jgi:hypothetical protein